MHDIRFIRDNPAAFDAGLKKRNLAPKAADLLKIDEARRAAISESEAAQAKRKALSRQIGIAKSKGEPTDALMSEVAALEANLRQREKDAERYQGDLTRELEVLPNLPFDDVPDGTDETGNVEIRRIGNQRNFSFTPKDHQALGEAMGEMDFAQAAKISGSRFVFLKGRLARLERAIAQFMLDLHTDVNGYTEVSPPLLVKDAAVYGVGQLPKFKDDLFQATFTDHDAVLKEIQDQKESLPTKLVELQKERLKDKEVASELDNAIGDKAAIISFMTSNTFTVSTTVVTSYAALLADKDKNVEKRWLIPTAEVPLTNLVSDTILNEKDLPLRFTAWTPCFRSEAGAAGKDTRGMIRQHQFPKVELVSIVTPEQSAAEHERMTASAEEVLKRLGLAYRTVVLCSGDMGFSARKTYDIEVWLPGQNAYREISSCSNCGEFQARRMNARYRPKEGKGTRFVHTLNGSGLAVGRTLIAVLENYQNEDGSVTIPEALRPYMGGLTTIPGPVARK
jgi:seryl-tRNA synthetase